MPEGEQKRIYGIFPPARVGGDPRVVGFTANEMTVHAASATNFYAVVSDHMVQLGYQTWTTELGQHRFETHIWTYATSVYNYEEGETINKGKKYAEVEHQKVSMNK